MLEASTLVSAHVRAGAAPGRKRRSNDRLALDLAGLVEVGEQVELNGRPPLIPILPTKKPNAQGRARSGVTIEARLWNK
jgi:hypothetical protein